MADDSTNVSGVPISLRFSEMHGAIGTPQVC